MRFIEPAIIVGLFLLIGLSLFLAGCEKEEQNTTPPPPKQSQEESSSWYSPYLPEVDTSPHNFPPSTGE